MWECAWWQMLEDDFGKLRKEMTLGHLHHLMLHVVSSMREDAVQPRLLRMGNKCAQMYWQNARKCNRDKSITGLLCSGEDRGCCSALGRIAGYCQVWDSCALIFVPVLPSHNHIAAPLEKTGFLSLTCSLSRHWANCSGFMDLAGWSCSYWQMRCLDKRWGWGISAHLGQWMNSACGSSTSFALQREKMSFSWREKCSVCSGPCGTCQPMASVDGDGSSISCIQSCWGPNPGVAEPALQLRPDRKWTFSPLFSAKIKLLAKLTVQIKSQHRKHPAEISVALNRHLWIILFYYLLTLECYVEMVTSRTLKLEITNVQGFCAPIFHCYVGSAPTAF